MVMLKKFLSFLILCLVFSPVLHGAASNDNPVPVGNKPLVVGVCADSPFVIIDLNGEYSGFAIELWERVAAEIKITFTYRKFDGVAELLEAISKREIDVALSDMAITSQRMKEVDFSHPFFDAGLRVMINNNKNQTFKKLWNGLIEGGHLKVFAVGLVIVLLGTIIFTLVQRHYDKEFTREWTHGLADSFYHVMSVTMTGKSNHKGIPGPMGRVVAGIWLACGVAIIAYITSSITSVMTANTLRNEINGPNDLGGKVIGVIQGSPGELYCAERHLETVSFKDLPSAVNALVKKRVNAIIDDAPLLQYYDNSHPELPIGEVGPVFNIEKYGFALPTGSPLRRDINHALLKLEESGYFIQLKSHYFGTD